MLGAWPRWQSERKQILELCWRSANTSLLLTDFLATNHLEPIRMPYRTRHRGKKLHFPPGEEDTAPKVVPHMQISPGRARNMVSQMEMEEQSDVQRLGFQEVMAAIALCQTALTNKIEAVQLDVSLIRQDFDKLRARVSDAEQRVRLTEDTVTEHTASICTLQMKVRALEYKVDNAENRNRRNNLHIVGMPEGAEGKNPTVFVEELLRGLLPAAQFSPYFTVECAHRIPPVPGLPGSNPRTLIFRLLNFRDRDEILRIARRAGELKYQNATLMFFPDFSLETQKLRRSFDQVKVGLQAQNIKYSILFPAKLRVQEGETGKFFTAPCDAAAWLDSLPPHRQA